MLFAATLTPMVFTACTDDETVTATTNYTGVYKTKNDIRVGGFSVANIATQNITLSKEINDSYTLTVGSYEQKIDAPNSPIAYVQSEPMIIKGVQVLKGRDGVTRLSGKINTTVKMLLQGTLYKNAGAVEYQVKEGTVVGTIDERGRLDATLSFTPGNMPMPLIYVLSAID